MSDGLGMGNCMGWEQAHLFVFLHLLRLRHMGTSFWQWFISGCPRHRSQPVSLQRQASHAHKTKPDQPSKLIDKTHQTPSEPTDSRPKPQVAWAWHGARRMSARITASHARLTPERAFLSPPPRDLKQQVFQGFGFRFSTFSFVVGCYYCRL